jgi:hypothetical protein
MKPHNLILVTDAEINYHAYRTLRAENTATLKRDRTFTSRRQD